MSDILQNTDNTRLYGLNTTNCCSKDQSSEKVANALLPIVYGIYSENNEYHIPVCNNIVVESMENCFPPETKFDTEKAHSHHNFINPPQMIFVPRFPIVLIIMNQKLFFIKRKKQNLFSGKIAMRSIAYKVY